MKNRLLASLLLSALAVQGYAQDATVTVNYTVQRYLGNVSSLDRTKYFNLHSTGYDDAEVSAFFDEYGVGCGRGFWGPLMANSTDQTLSQLMSGVARTYPETGLKGTNTDLKQNSPYMSHYVATEHPAASYLTIQPGMDVDAAANWVVEYYNNYVDTVPHYYEPLNEPFVHVGDADFDGYYDGGTASSYQQEFKQTVSELYNAIGREIHADSKLSNMKVVGYSAAYPSYELNDFKQWDENMKLFMDIAGDNMDGFSIHLYDGVNITGRATYRSGSNAEALLDLLEAYSYTKWGYVKPHCATEYGGIVEGNSAKPDNIFESEGIYSSYRVLPAISHLMFNYMERQNDLMVSIPFIGDKSGWYITAANDYGSYSASMWHPNDPVAYAEDSSNYSDGWYINDKVKFFELWKGVKGDRVEFTTDNIDIQTLAFRDGNTLYLCIDNLNFTSQTVALNSQTNWTGVSGVVERKFSVGDSTGLVYYEEINHGSMPTTIDVASQGTTIVVATITDEDTSYSNTLRQTKYYSSDFLQKISANSPIDFNFSGVDVSTGFGYVTARMSIGIDLPNTATGFTSAPFKFEVNGTEVDIPDNLWRGHDQTGRDDFFGMLEIPFDISLLKSGDNVATVTYYATGGYLSSLVLQVQMYDDMPDQFSSSIVNGNFETSSLANWVPFGSWATVESSTDSPLSGARSLKIYGQGGVAQTLSVSADASYSLTATVKGSSDTSMKLMVATESGGVITSDDISIVAGVAQSIELPVTIPSSLIDKVVVSIQSNDSGVYTWVDNVYLIAK